MAWYFESIRTLPNLLHILHAQTHQRSARLSSSSGSSHSYSRMSNVYPTVNGVQVLLPAPSEYIANLDHPQRNGDTAVYWAFGIGNILALLLLGQRLYTKIFLAHGLQIDDSKEVPQAIYSHSYRRFTEISCNSVHYNFLGKQDSHLNRIRSRGLTWAAWDSMC